MRLLRYLAEKAMLLYPIEYRIARGDDIQAGLEQAFEESSAVVMVRHVLSVAVHAWRIRVQAATADRRSEVVRQGLTAAIVIVLGAAIYAAQGWQGWPYTFATAWLFAGAWAVMGSGRLPIRLAGVAAIVVAGREFYDSHQVTLPLLGEFSVGIVLLVIGLRFATAGRRPGRYLLAVAAVGIGFNVVGGPSYAFISGLAVFVVLGLVAGTVDPRAAVATAATFPLVALTRPTWWLGSGFFDRDGWWLAAALTLAAFNVVLHLRRDATREAG